MKHIMQMDENMPVTGEIKMYEIPSLILAYITVHYSAVFLVILQIIWHRNDHIFFIFK